MQDARSAAGRRFGAFPEGNGVRFLVAAPGARTLELELLSGASPGTHHPLRHDGGTFEFFVPGAGASDTYLLRRDGTDPRPDPASRFQPEGVHGPSEIVDADAYRWRHDRWDAVDVAQRVIYELHVGTFTPEGTFAAARARLPELRDLGITVVELMPVADFAGMRNWGYDGVCLYAPSRAYGRPDDLRAFVDAAHGLGMAVVQDVVYNHLGPEGAYLPQLNPQYLTDAHQTPWGCAVNLDAEGRDLVRAFIIDNAEHWVREYRLDGLRLDATHALIDTSPVHLVADLVRAVRAAAGWPVAIYGEDHRNLADLVESPERNGWGLDGVWADDFHHVVRRMVAGDAHGYYQDFEGTADELVRILRQGWLYSGEYSRNMGEARGTDPSGIPMHRFVVCLQNHDQVGNRATGDRLHHRIDAAAWRAASAVLLTAPMTPLIFMGQEWAASTPFLYFTDLEPDLGRLVTEGRRREFKAFPEFADPAARERIPDPQAASTFEESKLKWDERNAGAHAHTLALYRELLRLRREQSALGADLATAGMAEAAGQGAVVLRREHEGQRFVILARLTGEGAITLLDPEVDPGRPPMVVLSTEDARFAADAAPPQPDVQPGRMVLHFSRPGAVILTFA